LEPEDPATVINIARDGSQLIEDKSVLLVAALEVVDGREMDGCLAIRRQVALIKAREMPNLVLVGRIKPEPVEDVSDHAGLREGRGAVVRRIERSGSGRRTVQVDGDRDARSGIGSGRTAKIDRRA